MVHILISVNTSLPIVHFEKPAVIIEFFSLLVSTPVYFWMAHILINVTTGLPIARFDKPEVILEFFLY